jgi:hypothetical protein
MYTRKKSSQFGSRQMVGRRGHAGKDGQPIAKQRFQRWPAATLVSERHPAEGSLFKFMVVQLAGQTQVLQGHALKGVDRCSAAREGNKQLTGCRALERHGSPRAAQARHSRATIKASAGHLHGICWAEACEAWSQSRTMNRKTAECAAACPPASSKQCLAAFTARCCAPPAGGRSPARQPLRAGGPPPPLAGREGRARAVHAGRVAGAAGTRAGGGRL